MGRILTQMRENPMELVKAAAILTAFCIGAEFYGRQTMVSAEAVVIGPIDMCAMDATVARSGRTRTVLKIDVPCERVGEAKAEHTDKQFTVTTIPSTVVRYTLPDGGSKLAYGSNLYFSLFNAPPSEGDAITIMFDPKEPQKVRSTGAVGGYIIAVAPMLFGFFCYWLARRKSRRDMALGKAHLEALSRQLAATVPVAPVKPQVTSAVSAARMSRAMRPATLATQKR